MTTEQGTDDDTTGRTLAAVTGSNGTCHCVHVSELLNCVDAIELRTPDPYSRTTAAERGGDPWQPGYEPGRAHRDDAGAPGGRATLPLRLEEPLGSAWQQGKSLFDDKLTTSEECRFQWGQRRTRLERQERTAFHLTMPYSQGCPRVG